MKQKQWKSYREELLKTLQNPEESQAYLNAALQEDDQSLFLLALKDVIEAQYGTMVNVSKASQLNRENLYRIFSSKGNPQLKSVMALLNALGLHFSVTSTSNRNIHFKTTENT